MNKYGRNSKLISAYTALATVALGIVAFASTHPLGERILIADFSAYTTPVESPVIVWAPAPQPVAQAKIAPVLPEGKSGAKSGAAKSVTIASYTVTRK